MTEEERYWREHDFFVTLLDQIPYFIFWKNKESVFLGCNQRFAKIAGLNSPEEIIGKTDYDLPWSKQESDLYRADDQQVIKSKIPKLNIEEPQTLPDGSHIVLLTSKVPLIDKNGEAVGILGIYNDITERKQMELELQIAKDKAEVANKLKTEFIENMQHDLRTPAAGVYQILNILSNNHNSAETLELLPVATKASKELLDLCNEVIDFENIEYNKHKISSKKIDLHDIAARVIALHTAAAKHKNIKLILEMDPNLPAWVEGDSYRLKKILTNLIGNSLKFTEIGEVKLTIHRSESTKDTIFIQFIINDTGIGIPKNKKNIIFEKFTRLNPSNKGTYKGTGLGLHYVKKFVTELKGQIQVESQVGTGTSFHVILPFSLLPNLNQPQPDTSRLTEANLAINSENIANNHVLLIEDDPLARFAAKKLLEKTNYQLSFAVNMAEAIKSLNSQKFHLVISDLGLPDGSGFDIIRQIKQSENSPNYLTPFIALTAHTNEEKRNQAIEQGFAMILAKPLTQEMITIIKNYGSKQTDRGYSQSSIESNGHAIIDIQQTINRLGYDKKTAFDMLALLAQGIKQDKLLFEQALQTNNISQTRELFHKIKGGLNYCGVPRLQNIVNKLHDEVKKAAQLSTLQPLYEDFYKEIDDFIREYERLQSQK